MSDGSLSQDEIDALLQGGGGPDFGGPGPADSAPSLSSADESTLSSLVSGYTGTQAGSLTGMLGKSVTFGQPRVELCTRDSLLGVLPDEVVEIQIDYSEAASGEHSYLFNVDFAAKLAGMMMGQDGVELNDAALSALEELGNTMAGAAATALGDKAGGTVMTAPGSIQRNLKAAVRVPPGNFVKVTVPVNIEGESPSDMIEIYSSSITDALTGQAGGDAFDLGGLMGGGAPMQNMGQPMGGMGMGQPMQQMGGMGMGQPMQQMGGMGMGQPMQQMGGMGMGMGGMMGQDPVNVQSVQFPSLMPQNVSENQNIGLLMDVNMEMTVELGRTKMLIRDILRMGEGTILELDKLAGEAVDILVNHKLIAKGEVVVIDENFGVRVTEIVAPADRLS